MESVKRQRSEDVVDGEAKKARLGSPASATRKFEPPTDHADLIAKVQRQVEYYLSDANLQGDSFFHGLISGQPDGWLFFKSICSCKRIQNLQATPYDIVEALRQSSTVELNEEALKLQKPPPTTTTPTTDTTTADSQPALKPLVNPEGSASGTPSTEPEEPSAASASANASSPPPPPAATTTTTTTTTTSTSMSDSPGKPGAASPGKPGATSPSKAECTGEAGAVSEEAGVAGGSAVIEEGVLERCAVRRKKGLALPSLRAKPQPREVDKRNDDHHGAGCLIKLVGLPEEASWETVKEELVARLPEGKERPLSEAEKAMGKKPFVERPVRFVSPPDGVNGVCFAYLSPFENDQEVIGVEWLGKPMVINGQEVKIQLITEFDEAMKFVRTMPSVIQKRREREILDARRKLNSRAVILGESKSRFESVDHLRQCLKEVMRDTKLGVQLNKKTCEVLRHLLQFHPNSQTKLQNLTGFKVDIAQKDENNKTRCFFIIKEDGTSEDFSLSRCFQMMAKNPPYEEDVSPA